MTALLAANTDFDLLGKSCQDFLSKFQSWINDKKSLTLAKNAEQRARIAELKVKQATISNNITSLVSSQAHLKSEMWDLMLTFSFKSFSFSDFK